MKVRISLLLVHYKTPERKSSCLESLFAQDYRDFEVIIIDNEANALLPEIVAPYKTQVTLIQNKENVGFGRANNQAAARATGEYLFLLNPDAMLLQKEDLQSIINFAEQHRDVGVIGLKILDQNGEASTPPRHVYPGLKRYQGPLFHNLPGTIAWVLGAGMVIPREVFNSVHGFDPDFFLYGEEADLCLRIREQGYPIIYCENIALKHLGGASEKTISEYEYWLKKQRGLYLFYTKHYPEFLWRKLLKKDLVRANYRLFVLWFEQKFKPNSVLAKKCERNRAIKESVLRTFADPAWLKYFK
jgi:N-acetylglucosaminyl-diphospho-decaprenol L-rhamnosyltransferase